MKRQSKLHRSPNRIMFTLTGVLVLLTVMIVSSKPRSGEAATSDFSSLTSKYPILVGTSLQTCSFCHTASIPMLNPYGAAYKANGRNVSAFGLIEGLDSDGDGVSNIQEINSLTFPGDPASVPVIATATKPPAPTNTGVPTATKTAVPTNTNVPVPTNTPLPTATGVPPALPTNAPTSAFATTGLNPASILVGGSSNVTVSLNNVPANGFASAEFTCKFSHDFVQVSSIAATNLFGADPVSALNGPGEESFIFAIAGSNGNKAMTGGAAFTFSVKGLKTGQSEINCQARVSTGNLSLTSIPSTPASLVITSAAQGSVAGRVLAGKPVTVTLYDSNNAVAGSVQANADGTFSLSISAAGNYKAMASAPGYLKAQGSVNITNGNTTTLQTISLLAGDVDGNGVVDQFDAMTIGMNYNQGGPAAADLNNDGNINVLDLELLAANYHKTGPTAWQ